MKGIVFTEFANMVEDTFGMDMMDDLIDETHPDSGGAYTTVGTYDHHELVNMVVKLSEKTGADTSKLIMAFGHHLGKVFVQKFPDFFNEVDDTIAFLKKIDNHIHVEVRKLYPDAELPKFTYDDSDPDLFKLVYESERGFADLAQGLIEAASEYFGEELKMSRQDNTQGDLHVTEFILTKVA